MTGPYREPGVPTKHFTVGQYVRINDPERTPTPLGVVIGKDVLKTGHWLIMSIVGMHNIYSARAEKMEDIPLNEFDQLLLDMWRKEKGG